MIDKRIKSQFLVFEKRKGNVRYHGRKVVEFPIGDFLDVIAIARYFLLRPNTCIGLNGDMYSSILGLYLNIFFQVPIIFFVIASPVSNYIMTPKSLRNKKDILGNYIYKFLWRKAKILCGSRIMHYEVMYTIGEEALNKYISTDHIVRAELPKLIPPNINNSINSKIILLITRFEKMKRSEDAIDAFLISKASKNGFELHVLGDGNYLPLAVYKYKLFNNIIFKGRVSNSLILKNIESAYIVVAPHSGGVSIEAGIVGRPIIAYGTNAMPEYIVDGFSGFLIDSFRIEDIKDKIDLLVRDKELYLEMCLNSQKFIYSKYSEDRMKESKSKLINAIIKL
ncbi:glycosyltransferase family 4 protein [Polynucleobacter sp. JS-Mosq-20-D10]|nr:glycosyltransferase family 4 protein [Polynucleobacter sp. JS-Mosq-20-D10]